jgi:lipid-binding SYLF domain-containing protein
LQAGVQETKVVLVFMNNDRLHAAIDSGLTLGGDASIAAGSKGAKSIVSTTTAYKDIYYFVDVGGVFAGVSLEGNVIKVRKSLNEEYYGTGATPWNIVKNKIYKNSGADALKNTLSRIKQ